MTENTLLVGKVSMLPKTLAAVMDEIARRKPNDEYLEGITNRPKTKLERENTPEGWADIFYKNIADGLCGMLKDGFITKDKTTVRDILLFIDCKGWKK